MKFLVAISVILDPYNMYIYNDLHENENRIPVFHSHAQIIAFCVEGGSWREVKASPSGHRTTLAQVIKN